jgi:arylsulfatase A-like enzyme
VRILYIDIDTTRPDHLGCYGYHRRTSPHIDQIASEGMCFTNCYASDVPCLPSRNALFTGRFGINSGVVNHGGVYADARPEGLSRQFRSSSTDHSLAERLRQAGWHTASISPFPHRHSAYQIWEGFHEMFDVGDNGHDFAHSIYPSVERWLTQNASKDQWFLHVNFWDPHGPYNVPLEYGNPFENDPAPAWLTQDIIDRQRASCGIRDAVSPNGFTRRRVLRGPKTIANLRDWKDWIDGYDVGISHADSYVGRIVDVLKRTGIYDDTAIIVSSDHGESQGELEVYGDHQTADQSTSNIPLVIRWPGVTDRWKGRKFNSLVYHIDFGATLVELAGGKPPDTWDGVSFAPALKSNKDSARDSLVLSQCAWSCQRSVRWDDYLLIRTYDTGLKNFPSLMLFNVMQDPHELRNLAPERPDLVGAGMVIMDRWVAENLIKTGYPDPLFQVIAEGGPFHPREEPQIILERLRATNRSAHADWLARNGGKPRDE